MLGYVRIDTILTNNMSHHTRKQLIRLIPFLSVLFFCPPNAAAEYSDVPPCSDWKGRSVVELPHDDKILYSIYSTVVRVLDTDPLVLEALADPQLVERNFSSDSLPTEIPHHAGDLLQLPLTADVESQRTEYAFDDITVVDTYQELGCLGRMTWSGGEHRPVIVAVTKVPDNSGLYHELGTLLRFGTPGGGVLRLHENGQAVYLVGPGHDMRIDGEFVSPERIERVRAALASANIQSMPPADISFRGQGHGYFLMAADTEYYAVRFDQPPARFKPLMQELGQITGELAPKFMYRIYIEKKVTTNVFKWTPREIGLGQLAELQERKIEWWDQSQRTRFTKQDTDMFAKLYKPLPEAVLNLLTQTRKQGKHKFVALDGAHLYEVSQNKNPNALAAAGPDTYGTLTVIRLPDNETKWLQWPAYLGIRLADIPPEGLNIGLREYQDHAFFYDTLDSASSFIDGDYEYRGIRIERKNGFESNSR